MARGYPVGTVRKWHGGQYRKAASGKWVPVKEGGASAPAVPVEPRKILHTREQTARPISISATVIQQMLDAPDVETWRKDALQYTEIEMGRAGRSATVRRVRDGSRRTEYYSAYVGSLDSPFDEASPVLHTVAGVSAWLANPDRPKRDFQSTLN